MSKVKSEDISSTELLVLACIKSKLIARIKSQYALLETFHKGDQYERLRCISRIGAYNDAIGILDDESDFILRKEDCYGSFKKDA